ncbi:hypothetical protein [Halorientalis regularis]|jgi:hypothetical protein|uniref:Uncharacterized protein n=1 Tax=Halorientalis regularis TaxID=660518 RepID=A0A1G7IMR4_9EURY|nr:hypothetical protein [Halorientalis regularis]SDF13923.1 hypothetical protein SAMN05216218_10411 [Halorientalis regularis]
MAAELTRRARIGFALALGGFAAALAGALVFLPLGLEWPAAVVVAGAVYVILLFETVLDDATFGGE